MSNRSLIIGIIVILSGGIVAAILMRQAENDPTATTTQDTAAGDTLPFPSGDTLQFPSESPPIEDSTAHSQLLEIGTTAPSFQLETLGGGTFSLDAHRGQVVLVNFWATWCEPCRDEMPDLQQLWEKYQNQGLEVIGVSLDEEGRSIVSEFHNTFPVEYPLLLNGGSVAEAYGADAVVPTSYLIDREGQIVDRHVGAITRDEFEERVQSAL